MTTEPSRLSPLTLEFVRLHPRDAAATLERLGSDELAALIGSLPPELGARVVAGLLPLVATRCLRTIDEAAAAAIVRHLPVDPAAALLGRLEPEWRDRIVGRLPASAALPLKLMLRYRPGTLGSIVDPEVITVRPDLRVRDVIRLARKNPRQLRKYLYVLDPDQRLIGTVDTRTCLLAGRDAEIDTLAQRDPIALRARSSLAQASEHAAWARFNLLPVVNRGNHFLGVVRLAALARALGREAPRRADSQVGETLLSLADLYWQGSAAMLVGSIPEAEEVNHEQ